VSTAMRLTIAAAVVVVLVGAGPAPATADSGARAAKTAPAEPVDPSAARTALETQSKALAAERQSLSARKALLTADIAAFDRDCGDSADDGCRAQRAELHARQAATNDAIADWERRRVASSGSIIAGGVLGDADVDAIAIAMKSVPAGFKRYVAYAGVIKVGGSLSWRTNNPGNLRNARSKIGRVQGQGGPFAVFATMDAGRAAQRALYLNKYGAMTVKEAIEKLTPRSENKTDLYLKHLASAGVDLDKDVKSQIDVLLPAVETNEGMIPGVEVARSIAP